MDQVLDIGDSQPDRIIRETVICRILQIGTFSMEWFYIYQLFQQPHDFIQ